MLVHEYAKQESGCGRQKYAAHCILYIDLQSVLWGVNENGKRLLRLDSQSYITVCRDRPRVPRGICSLRTVFRISHWEKWQCVVFFAEQNVDCLTKAGRLVWPVIFSLCWLVDKKLHRDRFNAIWGQFITTFMNVFYHFFPITCGRVFHSFPSCCEFIFVFRKCGLNHSFKV